MTKALKILHLEDDKLDAGLVKRVLKKWQANTEVLVVDNKRSYVEALIQFAPDIVLADHTLVEFNSVQALNIFILSGIKVPFILVTATMSEDFAVSMIKAGASDYVLKNRLDKLPAAIINSIAIIKEDFENENKKKARTLAITNAFFLAQESEKDQFSYELLENISQILAASNLYMDCAISLEDQRLAFVQKSKIYILTAISEIKNLCQVIIPLNLEEIGLVDTLNNLIESKRQKANEINFIKEWGSFNEKSTNKKIKIFIYRIVQEQLDNIIKYAKALSVHIRLRQIDGNIELEIADDGVGFDVLVNTNGLGFLNINSRAEINNGKMVLKSEPGKGCRLRVTLPL